MENKVERIGALSVAHKDGSAEYLLSDYEEDIKRILYTDVRLVPSGCFGASGNMTAIGSVEYRVVYLSVGEGLGGVTFTTDYEIPISCSDETAKGECTVELLASSVRPLSGRRLQGKYTLAARYACKVEEDLTPTGDAMEEEGCVLLSRKIKVPVVDTVSAEEREYAEVLCKSRREGKYLFSDADCRVERIAEANGGYVVSGTVTVSALADREEEGVCTEEVKIPFEEFVVCENMSEGARVCGVCHLKSLVLNEHAEEESFVCVASAICRLELKILREESCTLIRDLYSTERAFEVSYRDVCYPTDASMHRVDFSVEHKVKREAMETPEMNEILLCRADLRQATYLADADGMHLDAEASVTVLGCSTKEDGTRSFCRHVERIPVRALAPMSGLSSDTKLTPVASGTKCRAVFDGDTLEISLEHPCTVLGMREENARAVTHAQSGEMLTRERAEDELWVLYPDSNLWDTAKRHHLSLDKICADNSISIGEKEADAPELLSGIPCLWIE